MKSTIQILMLSLGMFLFTACGGGGSSTEDNSTLTQEDIPVQDGQVLPTCNITQGVPLTDSQITVHVVCSGGNVTIDNATVTAANQTKPLEFNGSSINDYIGFRNLQPHTPYTVTLNVTVDGTPITKSITVTTDQIPTPPPADDTTPPVITLNGNAAVTVTQFDTYTDAGATATDDTDGSVSVTTSGTVDTDTPGTYTITYTATDSAGNSATETRSVEVTAFSITHNGTTYGAVRSPYTGKIWLDRNLGAARVCQSFDDVACYGDYYQWGRNFDGHQDSNSPTTNVQATDVTNVGHGDFITDDGTHDYDWAQVTDRDGSQRKANWSKTDGSSVCPVGFRVPTIAELRAETLDNGVTNRDTAFSNFLKLPSAGSRSNFGGSMRGVGSWGTVWSSSASGSHASVLHLDSGAAGWFNSFRANGRSVRCLRD